MNQKVKKCPCCGAEAKLYQNYNKNTDIFFVNVRCENCGTQSKFFSCKENAALSNWDNFACKMAITAWNNRKPIESLLELICELDESGHSTVNTSWLIDRISKL